MACKYQSSVQKLVEVTRGSMGYGVRVASSGIDGLKLKEQLRLDLTITDIYTAGLDQMEMLSGVRKRPWLQAIPVRLMTAGAHRWPVWRNN